MPLLFFALGLIAGSFGNVLIYRLPRGESLLGRSHCPRCGKTLQPVELIPLISFIVQRGRCTHCGVRISLRYPVIECVSGFVFLLAYRVQYGDVAPALLLAVALWLLLLIAVIDAETKMIPDELSISLMIIGALYAHFTEGFGIDGVILGAGFFAVQWFLSRGMWLGSGDIILGAGIGALLSSWKLVAIALFLAYVTGAIVALFLLATHRAHRRSEIPFGPFLALGTVLALLRYEHLIGAILLL